MHLSAIEVLVIKVRKMSVFEVNLQKMFNIFCFENMLHFAILEFWKSFGNILIFSKFCFDFFNPFLELSQKQMLFQSSFSFFSTIFLFLLSQPVEFRRLHCSLRQQIIVVFLLLSVLGKIRVRLFHFLQLCHLKF